MPEIIALGGLIAAAVGLIKSFVTLPVWGPPLIVAALVAVAFGLGIAGGEITGTPLELFIQGFETILIAMGVRSAAQAGAVTATGAPIELRSK